MHRYASEEKKAAQEKKKAERAAKKAAGKGDGEEADGAAEDE